MGNLKSKPGIDDGSSLKWKSGPQQDRVNFSHEHTTFDDMIASKEFKDYLLSTLDSSQILHSCLDEDYAIEDIMNSFESYRRNPQNLDSNLKDLEILEKCTSAGIKVNIPFN
jgi:hypothetical protein